jgi:hypothetical protein
MASVMSVCPLAHPHVGRFHARLLSRKNVHDARNNAMRAPAQEGYNVFERGMSGGAPMASPRESKGSTKIAVPAPIEQKSQRTRNSTRPRPASKNGREFDPQVFLATIGEGRKALLFPKKQTIFAQGDPADAVFYLQTGKVRLTVVSKDWQGSHNRHIE